MSLASDSPVDHCLEDLQSFQDLGSPAPSHRSHPSLLEEVDHRDPDLSDDDGLLPEQLALTGLFPPTIFKSLLFKATNVAHLSSPPAGDIPPPSHEVSAPLFSELSKAVDAIPALCLFLNVVQRQWTTPGSAPIPSSTDRQFFNIAPELAALLQVPSVDAPIAALLSNTSISGEPDEGLCPEEQWMDKSLQWANQGAAWAIQSATAVSFFNRATLLWLQQL